VLVRRLCVAALVHDGRAERVDARGGAEQCHSSTSCGTCPR
jgi:hypothetical protein